MRADTSNTHQGTDWRTVVLLYMASTIVQVGQFGVVYLVLPVWLTAQGLSPVHLGQFDASIWLGMLPGLLLGPRLSRRIGERMVVFFGLTISALSLACLSADHQPALLLGGFVAGAGMGFRWVALEPWLYSLVPVASRGRLVGLNETLISLTPLLAPALAAWVGLSGRNVLYLGVAFIVAAMLPLCFTRSPVAAGAAEPLPSAAAQSHSEQLLRLGLAAAMLGGAIEGLFCGLFPAYVASQALDAETAARFLTVFGAGGLLLQYAIGWLTDHRGLAFSVTLCALGTALFSLLLLLADSPWAIGFCVLLLGGVLTAFLTLSLIAAMTARTGTLAGNVSRITMAYTLCGAAGPWAGGWVMEQHGSQTLMLQMALLALLLAVAIQYIRFAYAKGERHAVPD